MVVTGTMFGYPACYIKKKLFACIYEEGVVIKILENVTSSLVGQQGIVLFQSIGRKRMN
jgi:hypothetical protein